MGEESKGPERDASGRFAPKPDAPPPDESAEEVKEVGSGERPTDESPMERVERLARGDLKEGEWVEDISDTVAPSVGPKSVVFHHPFEGPDHDVTLDAMGNDKRRQVVGQSYGPSFARQAVAYGIAVAIIVALFIGGKIAVDKLDKPPAHNEDQAPWSASNAAQHPPQRFVDVGSSKPENSKPVTSR
jgi:hypothetical protein